MDAGGGGGAGGGAVASTTAGNSNSNGFIHSVVGWPPSSLFFWLLTVSLVAAIHLVSGYVASRSKNRGNERTRRRVVGGEGEDAHSDERILEIMRSLMPVIDEDLVHNMRTYADDTAVRAAEPTPMSLPSPAPAPTLSFCFKFQHQMPEITREARTISRETPVHETENETPVQEQELSVPLESATKQEEFKEEAGVEEEGEEEEPVVVEAAPAIVATTHNYRFLTERDFRGFVKEPEAMTVRVQESFIPPEPEEEQLPEQERSVVAAAVGAGFLSANDFRPVNEPDEREREASSGKGRTALERRKPGSSPTTTAASGRTSVEEFSGFDDSESESSLSDGYSVKELVVDSDSDWFLSEKDFPAAARDAASLRSYKAKVLKAVQILQEAAKLEEEPFNDSATSESSDSTSQAASVNSPSPGIEFEAEDVVREAERVQEKSMEVKSPLRDVEFEEVVVREAEEAEERSVEEGRRRSLQLELVDTSDDEFYTGSKKIPLAYDAVSVAKNSLQPSEKESDEAISDAGRSPKNSEEGLVSSTSHSHEVDSDARRNLENSDRGLVSSIAHSYEVVHDAKGSPDPSKKEFASTNRRSYDLDSVDKEETVTTNDRSHAVVSVSDDKGSPEPSEKEFVGTNEHSYEVASDAKSISDPTSDHADDAARQTDVLVVGKKKVEDEDKVCDAEDKWKDLTAEEEDELESLWEHQDLIEQLKLELKKVRSIGLPTIQEESETPKTAIEDLKPWRIDARFLREDPMDELNKFYKSYRERMRKFDILCYQKMYAIDFLQLRGSTSSQKALLPTVTSILSQNFRSSRRRSPDDPSEQFLKELRCDLETVYVGQMCLSWEFLRWQYEQARDLPESDPYHSHQYNQVAGEFQQFQVVVQRFIEDESFQGPRLSNYVNNRCVLRNLLQVPVIKEDSVKNRMEDQRKGNYVITSDELEDIMEESMRILWEFIKADKAETSSVLKGMSTSPVELQDPSEHELMMHIHASLQKKEKRLKDLLRTGNCLVKKFKKPKEDRSNQNLFFSQVDMRLVARVLRMPRITSDQLQWCHAKLEKIVLVDRKIHREPSFLLFPC